VYNRYRLVHRWVAGKLLNVQSESLQKFAPRFSLDLYIDRFVDSINKENTGISLFFSFKQSLFLAKKMIIYINRMREIVEIRDLATVITNLLSAIPWVGTDLVEFSYLRIYLSIYSSYSTYYWNFTF
jgi:hypothetical protein